MGSTGYKDDMGKRELLGSYSEGSVGEWKDVVLHCCLYTCVLDDVVERVSGKSMTRSCDFGVAVVLMTSTILESDIFATGRKHWTNAKPIP